MSAEQLYSSAMFKKVYADAKLVLVSKEGRVSALTHRELLILKSCQKPRTLTEHLSAIESTLGESHHAEVMAALDGFRREGLLSNLDDLLAGSTDPDSDEYNGCGVLTIPTAERPEQLQRCLRSFLASADLDGSRVDVHVMDDSKSSPSAVANASICKALAAVFPNASVRYGGFQEKLQFREALEERGIPAPVLRFGLPVAENEYTVGGNRNFILLATVGERLLSVDDDITSQSWTSSNARPGIMLGGIHDTTEWWFFPTRQAVKDFIDTLPRGSSNAMRAHSAILGKTVGSLWQLGGNRQIKSSEIDSAALLTKAMRGKIRLSLSGIAGDSGMQCGGSFLFAEGQTRAKLAESPSVYKTAMMSRETARAVPEVFITHATSVMSGSIGLDNRQLLPPFLPQFRNEDGAFGATLNASDPTALFAHVPVGVMHDSTRTPAYSVTPLQTLENIRVSEALMSLIDTYPSDEEITDPGIQLNCLAAHLHAIAGASIEKFSASIYQAVVQFKCKRLVDLDWQLNDGFCYPAFWIKDALMFRQALVSRLQSREYAIPSEWRHLGEAQALEKFRAFVANFAGLLEWWARIVETTKVLRKEGICPAMQLS